jgi:ABC-2 type transport system permease protein
MARYSITSFPTLDSKYPTTYSQRFFMIYRIALKELKEMFREGRFRVAVAIVFSLLVTSVLVSKRYYDFVNQQHEDARKNARSEWTSQGTKNPHSAAHYGTYAFKPKYPLALIDNGIDKYAGVSIFLEAHKRSDAQYMAAQDQTALSRFGDLTPDFVLVFLIPLLIILLGFNSISREQESGTLRLLLSQGVKPFTLAAGKWLGLFFPVLLLVLPVYAMAAFLLAGLSQFGEFSLLALTVLFGVYLVYYAIFVNLTLLVSSLVRKSSLAFVTLLSVWIISCLAMPKITSAIAEELYPYPTQYEFEEQIASAKKNGLDGHDPWNAAAKKLEEETLAKYGVQNVAELPFNWDAFLMQQGEEHDAEIYFRHYNLLKETYESQARVHRATAVLSPFLPTRFLSMAICRTDYASHWNFADAAERYRIMLVGKMNGDMVNNSKTGEWNYQADDKLWQSVPDFEYQPPAYAVVFSVNKINFVTLLIWLAASFAALRVAVSNIRVV